MRPFQLFFWGGLFSFSAFFSSMLSVKPLNRETERTSCIYYTYAFVLFHLAVWRTASIQVMECNVLPSDSDDLTTLERPSLSITLIPAATPPPPTPRGGKKNHEENRGGKGRGGREGRQAGRDTKRQTLRQVKNLKCKVRGGKKREEERTGGRERYCCTLRL